MIICRTPFRVSFFGGGSDYPAWYRQNGGAVLATSIDKYCYLTCRYLPPFFEHRFRIVYSKIEACNAVDEISHPAVRTILAHLKTDRGLEVHHDGDLPARSGMGSSSSFTVGLLQALHGLRGQMLSKHELAMESIHIEQDLLKETVGSQDQVLAAYGGLNHVVFEPHGEISVRPLPLTRDRIDDLSAHLMLVYTGIQRTASNVAGSYVADLGDKTPLMSRVAKLVDEGIAVLGARSDISLFGELLHEAWELKRSLGSRISNPEVEEMYEAARNAGALGGKLTGAGGGGFMLLFVRPKDQKAVRRALSRLVYVPIRPEFSGSQVIFYDPEQDYAGLDRGRRGQSIAPFKELSESES